MSHLDVSEETHAARVAILDQPLRHCTVLWKDISDADCKISGLARRINADDSMLNISPYELLRNIRFDKHRHSIWDLNGVEHMVFYHSTGHAYCLFYGIVKIQAKLDGGCRSDYKTCAFGIVGAAHTRFCHSFENCSCQIEMEREFREMKKSRIPFAKMPVLDIREKGLGNRSPLGDVSVICEK